MANPTVDQDLCVSCGVCAEVCSEVFELGPEDMAQVKADADLNATCIQDAVDQCPVGAISV
jgi:ferredoxin